MRFTLPLALVSAVAFTTHTLPVRAFPGASVNLVRIDAAGVKPLPDVERLLSQSKAVAQGSSAASPAAATPAPLPETLNWLLAPGDDLEISFSRPLPAGATGVLLLRTQAAPGSGATSGPAAGREAERIPFPSSQVFVSDDRLFMAISPGTKRSPGEITTVEFVLGAVVPAPETPVRFALAQPAVEMVRKQQPCPILPLPGASAAAAGAAAGVSVGVVVGVAAALALVGLVVVAATNNDDGGRGNSSQ